MPRISLVLPTYNGGRFLRESIDSCLRQTFTDFELIVVIDGSTDETDTILAGYSDPRLVTVGKENQGLPRALNTGFARARGEFWSWTSDDNLFLPDALEAMVRYLDTHSSAPMVCTDFIRIDDAGRTIGYDDTNRACFLYRADVARRVGEYRAELQLVEDTDFFLRLQHLGGPIERIPKAYYWYRDHNSSLTYQQGSKRFIRAMHMHYDHISNGIGERKTMRQIFFNLLGNAALYRDHQQMAEMLVFAEEKQVPFLVALKRQEQWLRSPPGWFYNKIRTALVARYQRLQKRIKRRGRSSECP
jgi:glycosyltransferase involved in cell wall biosynthesis